MPVHFKSTSEYSRKFCPIESRSCDATTSSHCDAGVKSDHDIANCHEPPLQHKKRLDGPPTSLSTNYFTGSSAKSEFALLGSQDKFSSNVPYQLKSTASSSKDYKNRENFDDPPPPSKQLKMQKRIKPLLKERHPPVVRSSWSQPVADSNPISPPAAPRKEKVAAEPFKQGLKDKDLKDYLGDDVQKAEKIIPSKGEPAPASNMNEDVKMDLKKGHPTVIASEAPADYSLKYKAGVAPPRPVRKFSEYQKQFQWKKGMKASPLLAAEQIVYRSSADLGPYKTDPITKMSEYKRQFQPWKPIDVDMDDLRLKLDGSVNDAPTNDQSKMRKAKRSKSAGAVLRNENKEVAEKEDEDVDEAAELKEKLKQTHGKIRRLGSEYRANFKSPASYNYKRGTSKGANPAQLTPAAPVKADASAAVDESKTGGEAAPLPNNWFAEVIELRRRAQEYRKRAQGTHFSREHLVQLMAKQTDFWDIESQASSTVRALNLEAPKVSKIKPVDIISHMATEGDSPAMSEVEEEALEEHVEVLKSEKTKKKKRKSDVPRSRRMVFLAEQKQKIADQQQKLEEAEAKMYDDVSTEAGDDDDDDEGRRTTPQLQQEKGSVRRHHLDLTTPAVGGALLTCPPSKSSKMIVTSRSGDSYVTTSDDFQVKQSYKKTYNIDKLNTMPILGMPSGDTHALRDEDADEDRVLETHYVPSPLPYACDEDDKENDPEQKVTKKTSKNAKGKERQASKKTSSQLAAVQENYGKTYSKANNPSVTLDDIKGHTRDVDDDVMSVSMMSVASSCSLASEVLERARRRRNEFWGKKN